MTVPARSAPGSVKGYLSDRIERWRTGHFQGQLAVLTALAGVTILMTIVSMLDYEWMPITTYVIPMLLGTLALQFRPLLALAILTGLCVMATLALVGLTDVRITEVIALVIAASIVLYESSQRRSGLPGALGELMLVDLKDRLQSQSLVPSLPEGWRAQSSMISAGGANFAGDFMVASLSEDEQYLEMVLVDVCGKGVSAGTQALQFAGALGGLIGALPPLGLFAAANDFLMRQHWDDGFATAVHVLVNLRTGDYSIINAGHPPALHWVSSMDEWEVDGARGTALGILPHPEFDVTTGRIGWGDALMFYTDGVVESHSQDFTEGIEKLRISARTVVQDGFADASKRIIAGIEAGDDDRAVLMLSREL